MDITDDERALLRAVCADPPDDTVRLAYADWLQERGVAARAEFIRLQMRLAGMTRYVIDECKRCGNRTNPDDGVLTHGKDCAWLNPSGFNEDWSAEDPDYKDVRDRIGELLTANAGLAFVARDHLGLAVVRAGRKAAGLPPLD